MKFGVGYYSLQSPPHGPRLHQRLYAEMLEQIEYADKSGFDSAWLTEHHFLNDGYLPSLTVAAAAIAARTNKINIGTGVLLLPLHNPIRVAEDAAVVDNISGGRFILGIGLGYRSEEFEAYGVSLKERKWRMEEGIQVLLKSWADGPFSFEGKYFKYKNLNVTPKPVQKPIPIWIGAYAEPAIRRTARLGFPLYLASVGTIPFLKKELDIYHRALEEYKRSPADIEQPLVRDVYVTREGKDKGWEEIKEHVTYPYKGYAEWGSMVDREGNLISDPNDPRIYDIVKEQGIFGLPEECTESIKRFQKEIKLDHLVCRFEFPGLSHEKSMKSIELFVKEVMPHFK